MEPAPRHDPPLPPGVPGVPAYVEFLPPDATGRPSPYSVEGYLNGIGDFALGAARAHGWQRVVAKVLVIALLLPVVLASAQGVWTLIGLLVYR